MPNRLTRLERIHIRAPIYFVTACTAERKPLLAHADVHETFLAFAREGTAHGAWIGAYVLMPDHLHALVRLDDDGGILSTWMKAMKGALSRQLRQMGMAAPHWQKGFFDHVLRSEESAAQKWEYIRGNPVRAGLVAKWNDWPYAGEIFPVEYRSERL